MSNVVLLILSYVGAVVLGTVAYFVFKYVKNNLIKTFGGGFLVCAACVVLFSSANTIQNMTKEKEQPKEVLIEEIITDTVAVQIDSLTNDSI